MVRSLGGWWWWMLAVGYRCRGGLASGAAQCGVREGGTRRGVSLPRVAWVRCAGETLGNDFTATTATPRLVACAESRPVSNTSPFPRLPSLPPQPRLLRAHCRTAHFIVHRPARRLPRLESGAACSCAVLCWRLPHSGCRRVVTARFLAPIQSLSSAVLDGATPGLDTRVVAVYHRLWICGF